jgi:hypothetical protein
MNLCDLNIYCKLTCNIYHVYAVQRLNWVVPVAIVADVAISSLGTQTDVQHTPGAYLLQQSAIHFQGLHVKEETVSSANDRLLLS